MSQTTDSPTPTNQPNPTAQILVTGAAGGRQGATGRRVTEMLFKQGFLVRAFVRTQDERAEYLHELGAEVVLGNLLDIETVRKALAGISRAYFCYPVRDDFLEAASIFAIAAKENGLEATVHISQASESDTSPSRASRQHWLAEQIFNWADIGAVHLLGAVFFENILRLAAPSIVKEGKIYLPLEESRVIPTVAAIDTAKVAARILADPAKHKGKRYFLTGPQALSIGEIAEVFSLVLKRPVEYVNIPLETWQQNFTRFTGDNPHLLQHLSSLWRLFTRAERASGEVGYEVSPVVRQITGSNPLSLEEFIRENAAAFAP